MLYSDMTWLDYHYFRSISVKTAISFLRIGRLPTKPLNTLTSRLSFEFEIANPLNLRCVIVDCSQIDSSGHRK